VLGDRDLLGFRQGYYDLLVGLLWREPAPALLQGLSQGLDERIRAARAIHPLLAEGWGTIAGYLADTAVDARIDAVIDEYTRLFIGPQPPELLLYESFYLAGHLLDRPLAAVRATLEELRIAREPDYPEPEDFLAFELEVMRILLRRQQAARDPDAEVAAVQAQALFLRRHVLVWGPTAARDLVRSAQARFYRGVGQILDGFLAIEGDLVEPWSDAPLLTLDAARRSYATRPAWRGPLLDAPDTPRRRPEVARGEPGPD
jgi:TorA maturation chaperone TorD